MKYVCVNLINIYYLDVKFVNSTDDFLFHISCYSKAITS